MTPIPILIDTDPGQDVDDVLAIGFAALRPELDTRAVTTVIHGAKLTVLKRVLTISGRAESTTKFFTSS